MQLEQIIKRPLILTEKGSNLRVRMKLSLVEIASGVEKQLKLQWPQ